MNVQTWLPYLFGVAALFFGIVAAIVELSRRRTIDRAIARRAALTPQQAQAEPPLPVRTSLSPVFAGFALVFIGVAFLSLNHVNRSINSVALSVPANTRCAAVELGLPDEAMIGEPVQVLLSGVKDDCVLSSATIMVNGKVVPSAFVEQPADDPKSGRIFEAWIDGTSTGGDVVRVSLSQKERISFNLPMEIGASTLKPTMEQYFVPIGSYAVDPKTRRQHFVQSSECHANVTFPHTARLNDAIRIQLRVRSGDDCGNLTAATLYDQAGSTLPVGVFHDPNGTYAMWFWKATTAGDLTIEVPTTDPEPVAQETVTIKTPVSLENIASFAKDGFASITTLLGVLVSIVTILKYGFTKPTST